MHYYCTNNDDNLPAWRATNKKILKTCEHAINQNLIGIIMEKREYFCLIVT